MANIKRIFNGFYLFVSVLIFWTNAALTLMFAQKYCLIGFTRYILDYVYRTSDADLF